MSGRTELYTSEDDGNFRLKLLKVEPDSAVRLLVSKPGYLPVDRSITPPVENLIILMSRQK